MSDHQHLSHFPRVPLPDEGEDFRVTSRVEVPPSRDGDALHRAGDFVERLAGMHESDKVADDVDDELRRRLGERLPVSHDDESVFVYAKTLDEAQSAARVLVAVADADGLSVRPQVDRWHHEAEEWRPASEPMPVTEEQHRAESHRLETREAADSAAEGPQWEVRVDTPHRHDAVELQRRLEAEGLPSRRWYRHLFLHCATEFEAEALAERIAAETPQSYEVHPMGAPEAGPYQAAFPFLYLGGLSGT